MKDILTVILGGGAGSRLHPLTYRRAKPAVPLAGRYRLIDIPISNCINSGINRIFVLTQFNSASLNKHIQRAFRFDRFGSGFVNVLAAEQTPMSKDWFQGTADAVRRVMMHIHGHRHSHVLILSGDQLYSMNYAEMFEHHTAHNADITIATIPVNDQDATGFGILKTDDQNKITEFYEKPALDELHDKASPVEDSLKEQGRVYLASMGIYIFSKELLQTMLADNLSMHDFGKEIIPSAIKDYHVVSYPFDGYWSDIGTIGSFYEANIMLTQPRPPFNVYDPESPIYTSVRTLPHAKVSNSRISNTIIAEASVIVDCEVEDSVIGIRSFIGRNAVVKKTIMMGADYFHWHDSRLREPSQGPDNPGIGEGSLVEGAIIDRNVSIGRNCQIINKDNVQEGGDGDKIFIRDGIIVITKNSKIDDDTII